MAKTGAASAAALAAVALIAACGSESSDSASSTETAEKTVRIAFIAPLENNYVQAQLRGANSVAEKNPGVTVDRLDTGFDATKQYNSMQDAITQHRFDGFVVYPVDPVGLVPLVKEAADAGIKVVSINSSLGPEADTIEPQVEGQSGAVFDPAVDRGKWDGELMVKACEGIDPCKLGYFTTKHIQASVEPKETTALGIVAQHSNIEVVSQLKADFTSATGQKVAADMLTANPDINVIDAGGDQAALGAILAVKAAKLDGKVKVLGGGGSVRAKAAIESGEMFGAWVTYPEDEGRLGTELVLKAIRGELSSPEGMSPAAERLKDGQSPVLTKDNVDGFESQFEG